jgi:AhpD family alkylhydroperoxidase
VEATDPADACPEHYHDLLSELAVPYRELRGPIGDTIAAYAGLHRAAMGPGVLPQSVKELLALVIAVTRQCDGCIASHARAAVRRGVKPEEVAEAIAVAILLNGGPATVYGSRAWAAYQEFAQAPRTEAGPGSAETPPS